MPNPHRRRFLQQAAIGAASFAALPFAQAGAPSGKAKRQYRVAIIGRGKRGDYGHGLDKVWSAIPAAEVIAVADEHETSREAVAKQLGIARSYADYHRMIDVEKPDIVTVAPRWPDCHRDMVITAAQAGCHIFMEKPFCRTLTEADEMVAACEENKVKLAISHQTRYSPRLRQIRQLIADGLIGDIVELRGRGKEDRRAGGEDLIVLGSHVFDTMRFLCGDPSWCIARVRQAGRPITVADKKEGNEPVGPIAGDEITATFGFASPTIGFFGSHPTRHHPGSRFGLHIYGTKGIITLRMGSLPDAFYLGEPSWSPATSDKKWIPITSQGLGQPEPLTDGSLHAGNVWACQDLLDAIAADRDPICSVYDARWTIEMIQSIYASHLKGGMVELPLKIREHPL